MMPPIQVESFTRNESALRFSLISWVLATSCKSSKHPCERSCFKDGQSAGEEANLEATLGTSGRLKAKSAVNISAEPASMWVKETLADWEEKE